MSEYNKKKQILLIGPLPIKNDVIGGAKVSFLNLVEEFEKSENFVAKIINLSRPFNRYKYFKFLLNFFKLISISFSIFFSSRKIKIIMLNVSVDAAKHAALLFLIFSKIRRKKFVLRFFGGDLDIHYSSLSFLSKKRIDFLIRNSDLVYLQTKLLIDFFSAYKNIRCLPTTRNYNEKKMTYSTHCRKIVFISQLRPEKGIREMIEVSELLAREDLKIEVYGDLKEGFSINEIKGSQYIHYRGPIKYKHVKDIILKSDLLVLPTYYQGEGLPGILIESLQLGVPVIATEWRSIPEIVQDGINGYLVKPKSVQSLYEKLKLVIDNSDAYKLICDGVRSNKNVFSRKEWQKKIESDFLKLI